MAGCSAIFYTHYHGDHLGFAADIHARGVPQFIGPLALKIMLHLNEHMVFAENLKQQAEDNIIALKSFHTYERARKIVIGDISVTPYNVSHSAPDSYMFVIECDGKKILHTGDFRDHGYLGKGLYDILEKYVTSQGIDILITEGTNVCQASKSVIAEQKVSNMIKKVMHKYKNVFILCSSADMDRLWSIHEAHCKTGRPAIADRYQKTILEIFRNESIPGKPLYRFQPEKVFDIKVHWKNTKLVEWIHDKGFTMLIRKSETFQRYIDQILPSCKPEETCIIYSMFSGYINPSHKAYNPDLHKFINQFPNIEYCHTSGHASKECIEKLCCMINTTTSIIPIHKEGSFDSLELPDNLKKKIHDDLTEVTE